MKYYKTGKSKEGADAYSPLLLLKCLTRINRKTAYRRGRPPCLPSNKDFDILTEKAKPPVTGGRKITGFMDETAGLPVEKGELH